MKKTSILLAIICMLSINAFGDEIDDLLPAIIQVESGGNPHAMSNAGAIGLLQIMPIVVVEYKREHPSYEGHNYISSEDLFKPEINKEIGIWYLRKLRDHYLKDIEISLLGGSQGKEYTIDIIITSIKNPRPYIPYEYTRLVINDLNLPSYYEWVGVFESRKYSKDLSKKIAKEIRLALMLSAYNGGITRLRKNNYDINKMPKSVQNYVKKVLKLYKEYK